MSSLTSFFLRHKILTLLLVLLLLGLGWLYSRTRGPYHDYTLDFLIPENPAASPAPGRIEVGVARASIAPDFDTYDTWTDVDGNNRYNRKIDTYQDRNGNGKFDGIWLAGFNSDRPAKGMNDEPMVSAIALRNNGITFVMVTLDSIGIFHNEYIRIRKSVDPSLKIDHIMFSATHCHEVPDTMKIWSGPIPILGYQPQYMEKIQKRTVEVIEEAVRNLRPADMYCAKVELPTEGFVRDTREPQVLDPHMYLMHFTEPDSQKTIATVVNWGNHPEALEGDNPMITADFVHYLREGVEKGVPEPNGVEGMGGMCLYFQGMVGGLMTPLGVTVPHRDGQRLFKEPTFDKAQALGENVAVVVCQALRSQIVWKNENPCLAVAAKTILAPITGMYKWLLMFGFIHEGYYLGSKSKSEINVIRIGDVLMLTIPGEIYPEIVEGGIEAREGRDYPVDPVEIPPLRSEMERHAKMAFVIGLANDEIGYIIPKSQWDTKPLFVYGKSQYGEENSPGPEVAPVIHRESLELLRRMNATFTATTTAAR